MRKTFIVKAAVHQSQAAQGVTAALRAHGWRETSYKVNGRFERGPATNDHRAQELELAIANARKVERCASVLVRALEEFYRVEREAGRA